MTDFIVMPGYMNSGAGHWQTLWQEADPAMRRFAPSSWETPELEDWIRALDRAVAAAEGRPCVLIAHSLSCLLIAHWSQRPGRSVAGALLVSVPDPASPAYPKTARGFDPVPHARIGFPIVVVASENDPYGALPYQRARAADWGARFVDLGAYGHINGQSGLGEWPEGQRLLQSLIPAA